MSPGGPTKTGRLGSRLRPAPPRLRLKRVGPSRDWRRGETAGHVGAAVAARPRPAPGSGGRRLTLEQQLGRVWEGLRADGVTRCPVCRGQLRVARGGHAGRCDDCGSVLE